MVNWYASGTLGLRNVWVRGEAKHMGKKGVGGREGVGGQPPALRRTSLLHDAC